ncbi:MAG: cytochrome C554 [Marinilabiliales bacterium]|nr:MAG: cytochrome C554 [Marinilabiliales bacterium]
MKGYAMNFKKALLIACSLFLVVSLSKAQDYEYIGAAKCKMCHNKAPKGSQYDTWKAGPHAKAFETLATAEAKKYSANPQTDAKCLACHSTYHSADEDLMYTIKAEEGVSCESCHGPGSKYKSMAIMKSQEKSLAAGLILPEEAVCKKCHNEKSPTFKGFNYAEYTAKIAHDDPTTE